jgi:hypothetical protein
MSNELPIDGCESPGEVVIEDRWAKQFMQGSFGAGLLRRVCASQ